ncbi:glycosyltransferase (plasmid) [Halarchaeum sp. CBA1220]|uniref:glycosyltransferase n=1 Tax=Halarchaeum sp. CBA1220 TaxID=1853682 RepID=UPI000F3A9020|nr:glycosyltransferase [Halarchaeum sp. CBA1220]QLC34847.1 glycosyltransferase [Halarchaeum sp. CBA1220]
MSEADADAADYRALAVAVEHPSHVFQVRTPFNHRSLDALCEAGVGLDVVSPSPIAPPVGPYSEYRHVPRTERWGRYRVHYPRFLYALPKSRFYHVSGNSMRRRLSSFVPETFETPHDVVHTCGVYLDGYGALDYCRENDVPLVAMTHAGDLRNYDEFTDDVQARIRETIDYASRVLTVSDELAAVARRFAPASKVETVPIGEDPSKFPTDRREAIRRELGLDPETKVLLYVGRFEAAKGVRELVAALNQLEREDVYLAAIGHDGDLRWWFVNELGEMRHGTHAFWRMDPVAVRRWHVAADLLVHPSHTEARPTVMYEAMAAETPILGTAVGGVPEMVADGETGLLVPPRDADALADAIDALLDSPDGLRAMGERGHRRLLANDWTWARHAERVREIHRDVMAE